MTSLIEGVSLDSRAGRATMEAGASARRSASVDEKCIFEVVLLKLLRRNSG